MKLELDNDSPVPIYHQIAEAIRRRIHRGELKPGARLQPLRAAAQELGVNLHTVRHAYAELAREGLVESRPAAGTRIAERLPPTGPGKSSLQTFIGRVVSKAGREYGLTADQLADAIRDYRQATPQVSVLECSQFQCEDLARQVEARWHVDAQAWPLDRPDLPDDGALIATYFHYNEIRRRWPQRLADVHFVSIAPDPALATRLLRDGVPPLSLTLCELDEPTLEAVAADLSLVLPEPKFQLSRRLLERAEQALALATDDTVLLPPRVWGALPAADRATSHLVHLRYVFNDEELDRVARQLTWRDRP